MNTNRLLVVGIGMILSGSPAWAVRDGHHARASGPTSLEAMEIVHGHLGPYVVLGAKMGDLACAKLGIKRHFGVRVIAECPVDTPQRCMVDGLQASTGATYGKGNIEHRTSDVIRVRILNTKTGKGLILGPSPVYDAALKRWHKENLPVEERARLIMKGKPEEWITVLGEFEGSTEKRWEP